MRTALALLLAKGWKQVPPRSTGRRLVWRSGSGLWCSQTDFAEPRALGDVGPVECPLAVDASSGLVYRYVCPTGYVKRDFSEVRSFDLNTGAVETVAVLGLNKWVLWLCDFLRSHPVMLTLVATDMPGEGICIQHQLGFFDLKTRRSLLLPLPRDAFRPLVHCSQRQELCFYGVEGYQRVDYKGKRLGLIHGDELPVGRGASYHPTRSVLALGGRGIALWDFEAQSLRQVCDRGHYPVWERGGTGFWFSETSSDLQYYSEEARTTERIVSVAGNPHAEVNDARPVSVSRDGRYLALCLVRRVKRREDSSAAARSPFILQHTLCVLDTMQKEIWQHPGLAQEITWVD